MKSAFSLAIDQSFVIYLKNFAECYLKTNTLFVLRLDLEITSLSLLMMRVL